MPCRVLGGAWAAEREYELGDPRNRAMLKATSLIHVRRIITGCRNCLVYGSGKPRAVCWPPSSDVVDELLKSRDVTWTRGLRAGEPSVVLR